MLVLTIDQIGSRVVGDRVDALLRDLGARVPAGKHGVVRAFDRTVGDEVQGAFDDPATVVDVALSVLRTGVRVRSFTAAKLRGISPARHIANMIRVWP